MGSTGTENTAVQSVTTRDYCENIIYKNGVPERIITPDGYILAGNTTPSMWMRIFQIKDHAGNVRAEAGSPFLTYTSGTCAPNFSGDYYPYGQEATPKNGQSLPNPAPVNLYAGNEFERTNVRMYDFHARWYDQQTGRFGGQDPLAEKYYDLSPYSYCGGDPINFSDPSGLDHVGKNENGEEVWRIRSEESSESISSNEAVGIGYRPANWYYVGYWNQAFSSVKDREIFSENEAFYAQQALAERGSQQSEAKRAALKRLLEGQRIVEGIDFNPCYEFRLLERNPGLNNEYPEFYIILTLASPGAGQVGITGNALRGFVKSLFKRNVTKTAPSLEKASGSYLLEFESGKFYAGKGLESRMMQSVKRIETQFGDKLLNKTFYPAANSKEAFINEHILMMQFGGPKSFDKLSPTYNLIFSPGKNLGGF